MLSAQRGAQIPFDERHRNGCRKNRMPRMVSLRPSDGRALDAPRYFPAIAIMVSKLQAGLGGWFGPLDEASRGHCCCCDRHDG